MSQPIALTSNEITDSTNKLSILLANTYLLYLKTQNYHWNVVDRCFIALHEFFEDQYKELAKAVDDIAERIRILGSIAPAKFAVFLRLATLSEDDVATNSKEMLANLVKDHNSISRDLRGYIQSLGESSDEGSIDFFVNRLRAHEKIIWMLRSHI
ncbi:MAG: Dps family protein [Janthinobacterium lividum]